MTTRNPQAQMNAVATVKIGTHLIITIDWITSAGIWPKEADETANSRDTDQTAPRGAVRSVSALFVMPNLSKYLEL